ncbi:hypothetical protein B0H19DRAFT_1259083 [Mycena capillaripes]|nr:hypothetical protein B0H19DRAFT_1259083 [Mycena capillaripes]
MFMCSRISGKAVARAHRMASGAYVRTSAEYVVEHGSNMLTFNEKQRLIFAFMVADSCKRRGALHVALLAEVASLSLFLDSPSGKAILGAQSFSAVLWVEALGFAIRMFVLIEALLNVTVFPARVYDLPRWSAFTALGINKDRCSIYHVVKLAV